MSEEYAVYFVRDQAGKHHVFVSTGADMEAVLKAVSDSGVLDFTVHTYDHKKDAAYITVQGRVFP